MVASAKWRFLLSAQNYMWDRGSDLYRREWSGPLALDSEVGGWGLLSRLSPQLCD